MKILFISDIHEDYSNLLKLFSMLENVEYDEIICLGDIAGYSTSFYDFAETRDASKCLALLREKCSTIILGNHDLNAVKRLPTFSDSFIFPPNWYELALSERNNLSKGDVWLYDDGELDAGFSDEDISFLNSCNEYQIIERDGLRILLSHYIFPNLSGCHKVFYEKLEDYKSHFDFMYKNNCLLSVFGHLHNSTIFAVKQSKIVSYLLKRSIKITGDLIISTPPVTSATNKPKCLLLDTENRQLKYL